MNRESLIRATLMGAVVLMLLLVGCAAPPAEEPAAPAEEEAAEPAAEEEAAEPAEEEAAADDELVLCWSGPQLLDAFQIDLAQGVADEAEELGMTLIHIENGNDPIKQASDIEDLLTQDCDALLIGAANSDAIVPSIEKANELGIPVFTEDQGATGGDVIAHFGNDNYCMGYRSIETLAELVGHEGKVMHITGVPGTLIVTWNSDAVKAYMETEPNMELVTQAFANWDPAEAARYTEDTLTANPDLVGIYVHSSVMTGGAIQVLKAQDKIGDVTIVSGAWDQESQDWMANGEIQATIEYRSYEGIRQSVRVIYDYLVNGTTPDVFFNSWPMTMHMADGSTFELECPIGDWDYNPGQ